MRSSRLRSRRDPARSAFSLVELVLVVVIIGVIAAIAVPRMSNAVSSASANALQATLSNVRKSIDVYFAEHGKYPGYDPANGSPNGTFFVRQLVEFTNLNGNPSTTRGGAFIYGPYLRNPFPKNPFNGLATVHVKANIGDADPANGSVGWVAVLSHGLFGLSVTDSQLEEIGVVPTDIVRKAVFRGKTGAGD